MKIFKRLRFYLEDLKNTFLNNPLFSMIIIGTFILGVVCGFIFNQGVLLKDLIISTIKEKNLFMVSESGFFPYFIKLILFFLKTILFLFLFTCVKNLYWCVPIIIFCKGIECAFSISQIFALFGIIAVFHMLLIIIYYLSLLIFAFNIFIYAHKNKFCSLLIDKYRLLHQTRFIVILIITVIILSLFYSILYFLIFKGLFI